MAGARTDFLGKRPLGPTGLEVTGICVGAAPLGSMPADYGEVGAEQGIAVARASAAGPFNFLDTANNYGDGRSERRIGVALRDAGGVPDGFVLATKVDPTRPATSRARACAVRWRRASTGSASAAPSSLTCTTPSTSRSRRAWRRAARWRRWRRCATRA